jgi:hypothetical protein
MLHIKSHYTFCKTDSYIRLLQVTITPLKIRLAHLISCKDIPGGFSNVSIQIGAESEIETTYQWHLEHPMEIYQNSNGNLKCLHYWPILTAIIDQSLVGFPSNCILTESRSKISFSLFSGEQEHFCPELHAITHSSRKWYTSTCGKERKPNHQA